VARFVGKITWTRDRLKRNRLFGAEDRMDLPYWPAFCLIQETNTHARTHTQTHAQIITYEKINQSAPFSACTVSSVMLSVEGWSNCKTHFNGRWTSS